MFTLTKISLMWDKIKALSAKVDDIIPLPAVTSSDNGKALIVSAGKWSKKNIPSQLPAVTSSDAGNALVVSSDGEWVKGSVSGLLNYSLTEQSTGRKWLDGKDIYVKTLSFTNKQYGGNGTFDTGVSNLDNIISFECVFTGEMNVVPGTDNTGNTVRLYNNGNGVIKMEAATFNAGAERTWNITLYYTKSDN